MLNCWSMIQVESVHRECTDSEALVFCVSRLTRLRERDSMVLDDLAPDDLALEESVQDEPSLDELAQDKWTPSKLGLDELIDKLLTYHNPGDIGFIQMLNAYGTTTFAGASIMVDDMAEIVSMEECPDCKEKGMTIKIIGRVKGSEAKGCGATLDVGEDK